MRKIFKIMGIVAAAVIGMILYTNAFPLTVYSKTETETKVYYTYECLDEYSGTWYPLSGNPYSEQQAFFTKDNMDTLREIKHTDVNNYKIRYQLKGFEIVVKDYRIV